MKLKLKEIRTIRGLTQRAVSEQLGCSAVAYSRYETGDREPSLDILIKIADLFGVSIDYLVGRREIPPAVLTPYESSLICAARLADERARQDALAILEAHCVSSLR